MVFWKLHAKSGMSYEQVTKHSFRISRAVLDLESNLEGKTLIIVEVQDEETVICHLSASYDQAPLDLNFEKGEHLKIIIRGSSDVHLSGYTLEKEKVTFNESTEEISKKRKKKTNEDKNNLSFPKQENGLLHKIKSEQIGSSEQKLSKKSKKTKDKENGKPFCILDDSSSKKKAKKEKESAEKLADLLNKSYDEEEDVEDEEYIIDEEDVFEEEGEEEEEEDEDMEEDYDEDTKEDDKDDDDDNEDDKEADDDDEDDKEDEEDDKEAIDISNGDLEEDNDLFAEASPEKRKRPLSPPSSAGRTPMIRSTKKAKKQEMSSPEMTPVSLKQKKQKVIDSPAEKEIKTQSELKREIKKGGLLCKDIKVGTGKEAKIGKKLTVYYEGKLKNGYTFDKIRSGPGFQFKLGAKDIIEAWNVGIVGMKVGGKRKIVVPPSMAYGRDGHPPEIPPNAFLSFEIELKSVL